MRRSAAALSLILVALVACRGQAQSPAESASLSIESPADGAMVQSPVDLVVSADGAEIGPPETGKMHFHVHIDGSDDYDVVTATQASIDLPPGEHTLEVVLAQPNHDETGTSASVTVSVSGGPGGGGKGGGGQGGGGGYGGGGYGGGGYG